MNNLNYTGMSPEEEKEARHTAILQAYNYLDIALPKQENDEYAMTILTNYLEELIHADFNRLLALLYRIDVSELKIKSALEDRVREVSTARIFAELIIERLRTKLMYRRMYQSR